MRCEVSFTRETWQFKTLSADCIIAGRSPWLSEPEIMLLPRHPAAVERDTAQVSHGDYFLGLSSRAEQRDETLVVLEPLVRLAEGVNQHQGVPGVEAVGFDDGGGNAMH